MKLNFTIHNFASLGVSLSPVAHSSAFSHSRRVTAGSSSSFSLCLSLVSSPSLLLVSPSPVAHSSASPHSRRVTAGSRSSFSLCLSLVSNPSLLLVSPSPVAHSSTSPHSKRVTVTVRRCSCSWYLASRSSLPPMPPLFQSLGTVETTTPVSYEFHFRSSYDFAFLIQLVVLGNHLA